MPAGPDPGHTVYRRLGTRSIAGLSCTDWLMHPKDSAELRTTICLTDDGVLLRRASEFGEPFLAVARHVEFGPIDPHWFAAPENFNRIGPREGSAPARP